MVGGAIISIPDTQWCHASLVIAMTIPISTNTTIAACIQIHVGDIRKTAYFYVPYTMPHRQTSPDQLPPPPHSPLTTLQPGVATNLESGHLAQILSLASRTLYGPVQTVSVSCTPSCGSTDPTPRLWCVRMDAQRRHFPDLRARLRVDSAVLLTLGLVFAGLAGFLASPSSGKGLAHGRDSAAAPLGGVNIGSVGGRLMLSQADKEIARARALHAAVVRLEVPWSAMEPSGPGQLEPRALAYADRLITDAAASDIKVLVFTDSTPCWGSSAPASLLRKCRPGKPSGANGWPPSKPSTFATFVAYLAQRYGSRLAAIEIWNEPDQQNELYFAGPNKPQRYAALLRAAYPAIKQADPSLPVLAGSLVGYNGKFLQALYAAGIKGYYNGLAVHFYTLTLASLRQFREVEVANGDATPLWLDEFGWSSCWPRYRIQQEQACVTPQVQAQNIINMFRSLSHTPYIAADVIYELQGSTRENFGVLNERGARKPSYAALARVLASPFGSPSPVTLTLRRQGEHVIASGSGPVGDYMHLEAFIRGELRFRALFILNRFNRYSLTFPAVLGTHGLLVRVYQQWMGPSRDAQKSI
jgi:polysaccharide biosynthesis protein PslG